MSDVKVFKINNVKAVFSEEHYASQLQFESASKLTALYCGSINFFKGEHAQKQFCSNSEIKKCCGYHEYKVKVIII